MLGKQTFLHFVLASVVCAFAPANAHAAEDEGASALAAEHFQRGYAAAEQGKFETAIAEFKAAYAQSPNVSTLYNLGQAYAAAGRSADAVATLERFLNEGGSVLNAERRQQIETVIRYHESRIGRLTLEIEPRGAKVTLDGTIIGAAPLEKSIPVTGGAHALLVSAPGFETSLTTIEVRPKQVASFRVSLNPLAAPAELKIECGIPGVEIALDGKKIGSTPRVRSLPVATGEHHVVFSRPGYIAREVSVLVKPGQALPLSCALSADPRYPQKALLRISHPAGTALFVDGAPFTGAPLPHGAHEIKLSGPRYETELRQIVLAPRSSITLTLRPARKAAQIEAEQAKQRRILRVSSYVAAGLGVASAAIATALYIDNNSRWSTWDDKSEQLVAGMAVGTNTSSARELDALLDEENDLRNRDAMALGFGVLGGVLISGAAVLYLTSEPASEKWVVSADNGAKLSYERSF